MQKSILQYICQNYFSIKSYSTFFAKMFKVTDHYPGSTIRKCILYMVYCIPSMVYTVDFLPCMPIGERKRQKMAK